MNIIDFTDEFFQAINVFSDGRPCALCKKNMYLILIKMLEKGDFGWICIGDTANDRTTIARMTSFISDKKDESLECSTYFGSEMGIKLPNGVKVVRPLINMYALETEQFLRSEDSGIQQVEQVSEYD